MNWLQIKFDLQRSDVEAFEDLLLATGSHAITLRDNEDEPVLEPGVGETPLWSNTQITALYDADINVDALINVIQEHWTGELPSYRAEILENKDWERAWMDNYHPMQFGERLWICPSWKAAPNPNAVNLMLDPGLAFGTGTHPTTSLCLKWLDEQSWSGELVLDFGCGSGILAIAALLLGADTAVGVDIDPQAVDATYENATRNRIDPSRISVFLPEGAPEVLADVTIANILAGPLEALSDKLIGQTKLGGKIVLSGLLAEQAEIVAKSYEHAIKWNPVTLQDGWARLDGTRIN
ncbi:50S ribosomal protein L11 methyltransferase [uncultured Umboniibacter sp.]|uniref:50S ribosomal protein L11 methyltransferase n=1 Tax=uncultured Umboniibacter sp. TaxID=1798917 RepID=UPI002619EC93|nr:50S ribosomal protein L11 methyltransferase [uncultured Umboniibacter sp.]